MLKGSRGDIHRYDKPCKVRGSNNQDTIVEVQNAADNSAEKESVSTIQNQSVGSTHRDPVIKMAVTPIFFFLESCSFGKMDRGIKSKYTSLAMLKAA